MAASKNTLRAASYAHDYFCDNAFNEQQYDSLNFGIRIQTLVKHGLVNQLDRTEVTKTWTPQEFCDYVCDELLGCDLWDYTPDIRWNPKSQHFEEHTHHTYYRF